MGIFTKKKRKPAKRRTAKKKMSATTRAKLSRAAKRRPRYKTGKKKGQFK